MIMRKITRRSFLSAAAVCGAAAALTACGGSSSSAAASSTASSAASAAGSAAADGQSYTVGICQLVQHDALDAATQGFVDALNTILGSEHVNIDVQVASGDSTTCTPIVNSFVNKKVDLIMANATPSLQAAYNATTEIPILGTAVTEYGVAQLRGQTLRERAKRLIAIAHPKFREELAEEFEKRFGEKLKV